MKHGLLFKFLLVIIVQTLNENNKIQAEFAMELNANELAK